MTDSLVTCAYCGRPAKLVNGAVLFPHLPHLSTKLFWRCDPCDAHVGCHPGKTEPLGSLANLALRRARTRAHDAFDPVWKRLADERGWRLAKARAVAYNWLAEQMGMRRGECHIGWMDEEQCEAVELYCQRAPV